MVRACDEFVGLKNSLETLEEFELGVFSEPRISRWNVSM